MKTGQIFKEILQDKGLKQVWLAKELNISPEKLNLMLKRDMKFTDVQKMCKVLNLTLEEFVQKKEDSAIRPRTTESSQTEI